MCVAELPRSDAQATQYVRTPGFRTLETASRGLTYDHRPASVLAERLEQFADARSAGLQPCPHEQP